MSLHPNCAPRSAFLTLRPSPCVPPPCRTHARQGRQQLTHKGRMLKLFRSPAARVPAVVPAPAPNPISASEKAAHVDENARGEECNPVLSDADARPVKRRKQRGGRRQRTSRYSVGGAEGIDPHQLARTLATAWFPHFNGFGPDGRGVVCYGGPECNCAQMGDWVQCADPLDAT